METKEINKTNYKIGRREFVKLTAVSGAFLAIGCIPSPGKEAAVVNLSEGGITEVNQYIFIDEAGKVILYNHRPEMGQGTFESIPMILAEELEVNIADVIIRQSPADRSKYGDQMVVGSRSIRGNFDLMRKMGAAAREMFVKAASQKWGANLGDCVAENGAVLHKGTGEKLTYGELVADAAKLKAPSNPYLKNPSDYKIIGKDFPRRDIPLKTNGEAKFGIDIQVPGMLYASIERSPVFLGKVVSYNSDNALKVPGVKHVFKTEREVYGYNREGVAVLADSYWTALQGRKALDVKWDNGDLEMNSSENLLADYKRAAEQEGDTFETKGDFKKTYAGDNLTQVEASYETPYQTHAPMEPMNAIVSVQNDKIEFWGSTQNPNGIRSHLSDKFNIPLEKVFVNYTFLGGGFGRRSMTDVVDEASDLSKKAGAPVKCIWTREDDLTQGPFRACSLNVVKGAVDGDGNLVALEHKIICQDIRNQTGTSMKASRGIAGGVVTDYAIPNFRLCGVLRKHYIPISYWRSVYHSTNTFAHESFIDELAVAAKTDAIDFRLKMLKHHLRFTNVLKKVAEVSGWYEPRKPDTGKGVAMVERSGALVGMVVEVKKVNGTIVPVKVTTAIDCGIAVHPDNIKAQTEGCIVMGLTAAIKSGLTVRKGAMVENNFDTYHMLQLHETPEMEVVVIKNQERPEGAGEAALPTVAPALTNAIFDLTKKRIRKLPFKMEEV